MEREKRIYSGRLLEVDFFPVFDCGRKIPSKPKGVGFSSEAQKKYNQVQATKRLVRLVNTNFDNSDYFSHPTYEPRYAPQSEKQARKDIANYLRRVKAKREKELKAKKKQLKQLKTALEAAPDNPYLVSEIEKLKAQIKKLSEPFKYVYVIELQEYKRGAYAGRSNWHFHLFMTGGQTSREIESMWKAGQRINCNNFQPERFGAETAARYMMKDPQGKRRFVCSRNLDKPITPPPKDGKVSRRTVERMATVYANDAEYWERKYKGYKFVRCFSRFNAYNEHWYVSVVMYKTDKAMPDWTMSDWVQPLSERS